MEWEDQMEAIAGRVRKKVRTLAVLMLVTCTASIAAGCVFQRAEEASQTKIALVGVPRANIEKCMGKPFDAETDGVTVTLTYNSNHKPDEKLFCKVDIEIQEGLVSRVSYSGWTGGLLSQDEQCAPVIEKCLAPHPTGIAEKLQGMLHF